MLRWFAILLPFFTERDRRREGFAHRLYVSQLEYCTNLVFHRRAALDRLMERLLDLNRTIGRPDTLSIIFGRSITRRGLAALGRVLWLLHGRSSRYVNQRDGTPGRQVWYKFSDRVVRSERHYWTCLHYIMFNPVKHGYLEKMADCPWSCIHELIREHGEAWVEDLRREYPLREFGRGWDD